MTNEEKDYSSIIDLKYPYPSNHRKMSIEERAAQFMPFAALKGYEEAIEEKERKYESKKELSIEAIEEINHKIKYLSQHKDIEFSLTYFIKENEKGGHYKTIQTKLIKIDSITQELTIENNQKINMNDIYLINF